MGSATRLTPGWAPGEAGLRAGHRTPGPAPEFVREETRDGHAPRGTQYSVMGLTRRRRWPIFLLVLAGACGPPKEAEDPRQILGDDLQAEPEAPSEAAEPVDAPASRSGATEPTPLDPPATRAECQAAAERMIELGMRAAAEQGNSSSAANLSAAEQAQIVKQAVDECLAWKTPRSEAQCVARAREETDIDGCVAK